MTYLCLSFSLSWLMLSPWSCWGFGWPHLKLTPHPHTPAQQPVACFIIICPFAYEAVYGRVRVWDVMSVLCHDDIWPRISIQLISSVSFVAIPPTSCSGCYASRVECPVACGRKLLKTLLIRIIYYGKCYDSEAASVNCHGYSVTYSIVPFWPTWAYGTLDVVWSLESICM